MKFRTRLIVATTLAVTIAVLFACLASYLATRNAVQRSTDTSLYDAAEGPGRGSGQGQQVAGVFFQIVLANGSQDPYSNLPVDQTLLKVANGHSGEVIRTVTVGTSDYRELIVPLAAGTILRCDEQPCTLTSDAAQVFSVNITGQQHELHVLFWRLALLALSGVLLALALGYLAAQATLSPLESVTNEIETVARTSDVSYRVLEGRNDELGRLRRVFNKLLSSVEGSQRMQRQLVLDASHELRTPLTSLRTNAQVLSRIDSLSSDEVRQITDDMVTQVDELASLITDLAELARGEGFDGTIEALRFDEVIDECVEIARTHARTRSVEIESDLEELVIEGRRDRLVRMVNNLINNAIKFAPEGGHVRVSLHAHQFVVEDDGPGVSSTDLPFIFDRFWRSPSSRGLPGSGLGLSIVAQVIHELGGTIEVAPSRVLSGAAFRVTLPDQTHDENDEMMTDDEL